MRSAVMDGAPDFACRGRLGTCRNPPRKGLPRVAATFSHGGTPASYMGTFPAFLAAWGPVDFSFGSGQGVKCVHSEHLYGELWHRAFIVAADTPLARYVYPSLTTIRQPIRAMAQGAVDCLIRHIRRRPGTAADGPVSQSFDYELVIRHSVAAPRK